MALNLRRTLFLLLVCLIAALGTIHIMLPCAVVNTNHLKKKNACDTRSHISMDACETRPHISRDIVEYPGQKYNVIPNTVTTEEPYNPVGETDISICTQTSLGNLHKITLMAETWDGRISIAVFAHEDEVIQAQQYILLLRKCSLDVKRKTTFHLVFSVPPVPFKQYQTDNETSDCRQLSVFKRNYTGQNYVAGRVPYPVNVLRNVALMYSKTPYVANLDVDFLPSGGLRAEMESFLKTLNRTEEHRKRLYILPCFESKASNVFSSKQALIKTINNGSVRQFNKKCHECQQPTHYTKWLTLPYPSTFGIGYFTKYARLYEPFYIAHRQYLPLFDGRFKGYGVNRFSQVCEAHVAGFNYAVMNNGFVVHDGFKKRSSFVPSKVKDLGKNRQIFNTVFKSDLKLKYPNSTRHC